MTTSEEYIAKLGFDSSDMEGSVQKLITLTGHLSSQFPELEKNLSKVERTLLGASKATQSQSTATRKVTSELETASKQTAIYNQYLYDQEKAAERSYQAQIQGLSRLRYAVYDVSNAAIIGGGALVGMAVLGAKTAIDMQRDFAQVVRTTGAAGTSVGRLRDQFRDLYTSLPASYQSLTEIGALGGQLDIPISRLKEFTAVTTKFSATTDVAVDSAATAFGRLDQLLPDVQGNYEGLADSILKVGVNSVATESQIINITSQIAPLANIAKLSSQETIGLAGALASLGVAPENARGNVTRLFGIIDSAVATGGSRLDDFAKLSGRTSSQFISDWQTAGKSQEALLDLFVGINSQGRSTTAVLRDIGITATRDQVTFSKLAQNTEVWVNSVKNAKNAGGELEQQYSVISSTVSAKLQVLANNFQQLVATVSDSAGGIGLLIDPLIMLLGYLDRLAANPGAATIATFGLALTAVAGSALLITGLMGRLVANYYAGVTAANELTGQTSLLTAAKRIATGQVNLFAVGLKSEAVAAREAAAAQSALTGATAATTAATSAATAATSANTAATARGAAAMRGGQGWASKLSGALGKGGLVGSILLALPMIWDLGNGIADWGSDGAQAAAGLNKSTKDYLDLLKDGQAQDALANLVANSKELGQVGTDGGLRWLRDISFSAGGIRAVEEQLVAVDDALAELAQTNAVEANKQLDYLATELTKAGFSSDQFRHYFSSSTAALEDGTLAARQAAQAQSDLTEEINETISANTKYISSFLGVQRSLRTLGSGIGKDGLDFSGVSEAGIKNLDNLLQVVDAIAAQTPGDAATIAANFRSLYNTLERAGVPRQALQFLKDTIAQLTVNTGGQVGKATIQFGSFFNGLASGAEKAEKAVEKTRTEIRTLTDYANDLGGVLTRAFNIRFGGSQGADAIASGWNRIREGIAKARDEIVGYKDGIADANQKLADLDVRMQEYQATLRGLANDRAVNQYWLRVANQFGNTLRAGQISADLAKNNADEASTLNDITKANQQRADSMKEIANLNKQIADAQERANFTLIGNTAAAIENRAALLGVIGDYNAYIQALADAGADSETLNRVAGELRNEFVNQATQAGLSAGQIATYSASFDDMKVAIDNVPRDITVSADPNPALQALNEFKARYYQDKATVESSPVNVPFNIPVPDIATPIRQGLNDAQNEMNKWQQESKKAGGIGSLTILDLIGGFLGAFDWNPWRPFTDLQGFMNALRKNYGLSGGRSGSRSGGGSFSTGTSWTGSGPKTGIAGVVHNQEAVLNARATSMIPSAWINSLNQGRMPFMPTVTVQASGGSGGGVTDLGSKTMREMAEMMAAMRTLIGDDAIAGIVDRAHSNTRSVGG